MYRKALVSYTHSDDSVSSLPRPILHVHGTSKAHAAVLALLQIMLLYHSAEKEIQPSKTPSRIKFSIHHAKVTAGKVMPVRSLRLVIRPAATVWMYLPLPYARSRLRC
jgi:hypothetical protein